MNRDTEEEDQAEAVHTMTDVLRNALTMGIQNIKPLLVLLEIGNGDQPYPAQLEEKLGMNTAALYQHKLKLTAAGLVTDFRDPISRSTRWSLTGWGVDAMSFIEDGGEQPTPPPLETEA